MDDMTNHGDNAGEKDPLDETMADPLTVVRFMQREQETGDVNHLLERQAAIQERLLSRTLEESRERRARPGKPRLKLVK